LRLAARRNWVAAELSDRVTARPWQAAQLSVYRSPLRRQQIDRLLRKIRPAARRLQANRTHLTGELYPKVNEPYDHGAAPLPLNA
jgi:hypothetical protein